MVKQFITTKGLKKLRINLSYSLNNALDDLKWDRMKLAEEYGSYMQDNAYTKGRISQLMKVNKGEEENSQKMLDWMEAKLSEKKSSDSTEKGEW